MVINNPKHNLITVFKKNCGFEIEHWMESMYIYEDFFDFFIHLKSSMDNFWPVLVKDLHLCWCVLRNWAFNLNSQPNWLIASSGNKLPHFHQAYQWLDLIIWGAIRSGSIRLSVRGWSIPKSLVWGCLTFLLLCGIGSSEWCAGRGSEKK